MDIVGVITMKILIISAGVQPLPVTLGGAVETLTEYLLNKNEQYHDFDITVISIYNEKSKIESSNFHFSKFIYLKRNKLVVRFLDLFSAIMYKLFKINVSSRLDYSIKLMNVIKREKYDKILLENDVYNLKRIRKYQNCEIYLHLHNDYLNENTKNASKLYNECDKIITVSEYIKQRVLTIPEANAEKVKVLRNCTNTDIFNKKKYYEEREELRDKLGISKHDIVFLFSGRLSKTKGIKELCLAIHNLNGKNFKLLILGSAWYGSNKKDKFVKEVEYIIQKISNKVIFTGFVDRDDVPKYHSVSDVAIIPSVWEEPAGLVVIEAMSSGLPLIVTNSGGIPEVINEEIAILVDKEKDLIESLTNAMETMMNDSDKRINMGLKAKEMSEQYTIERYYNDFKKILQLRGEK